MTPPPPLGNRICVQNKGVIIKTKVQLSIKSICFSWEECKEFQTDRKMSPSGGRKDEQHTFYRIRF